MRKRDRERGRKRRREGGRERETTHSVSESDSPTTDRFLCGKGGVFGY